MNYGLKENTVEIYAYSSRWKDLYLREETNLFNFLKFPCAIEHIGSTSVEGMSAKPIIDIAVGCYFDITEIMIENISSCGYEYYGHRDDMGGHIFRKHVGNITTHLLHLVEYNGIQWCKYILLKNLLKENSIVRFEYEALKKDLSNTYSKDRNRYREKKSEFLFRIYNYYLYNRKVKKISIFGPSFSGKSTIAQLISRSTGERVTHLDELFWQRALKRSTQEEWIIEKEKIYDSSRWIIDGNYIRSKNDRRISQSDLIIYLDAPTIVIIYRFLKAYLKNEQRLGILHCQRNILDFKRVKNIFFFNFIHKKKILNLLKSSTQLTVVTYPHRNQKINQIIKIIMNETGR